MAKAEEHQRQPQSLLVTGDAIGEVGTISEEMRGPGPILKIGEQLIGDTARI